MPFIQALIALLAKQGGKILNTVFGWATTMLFGKVPEKRQYLLSGISFGSVLWLIALIGIALPRFGTFMLAFAIPDSGFEDEIRIGMLVAALVIPGAIGFASLFLTEKAEHPKGTAAIAKTILKGYPYTFGLAITLILMTLLVPVLKIQDLVKRWTSQHVPMIIDRHDYLEIVAQIRRALADHGIPTVAKQASWMIRLPTKILTTFSGATLHSLISSELTELVSPQLSVTLHPADLIIRGKERDTIRVRAILTEFLTFTKAHLTWTKEANEIEDLLLAIWKSPANGRAQLAKVETLMRETQLAFEEWDILFRERLLVERKLLQPTAPLATASNGTSPGESERTRAQPLPRPLRLGIAAALTIVAGISAVSANATTLAPPPGSVLLFSLTHSGSGCPQGTTALNVAPDNLAFTLLFDSFLVEGQANSGNAVAASCVAEATIDVPAGWAFSVVSVDTRGFASVATVNASVDVRTRVALNGNGRSAQGHTRIRGPFSGDFQTRAELRGNGNGRWSPCNATRHRLVIDTEMKLRRESLAAVDSIDGQIEAMGLEWKRCP